MNKRDSMDSLTSFYQTLDEIPTPPLQLKRPGGWGYWSFALAPFGAALLAYSFMTLCASGPTDPGSSMPMPTSIDRYALDEIRIEAAPKPSNTHASSGIGRRSII